jgi:ectoine hydroxylase-related dioxygenase (phytanoyl-CoA dioxygenase family)
VSGIDGRSELCLTGDRATTRGEIEHFRTHGHVCLRGLASGDEIAQYAPAIERSALEHNREVRPLAERDTYAQAFLQVTNLWLVDPVVKQFVLAERFARAAAELLGVPRVRLYHDQALFKEAGGGHTPWHQDQFYWPLDTDDTITMWMPLAPIPKEVGTMRFASGVHERGHLGDHAIGDESERVFADLIEQDGIDVTDYGSMAAGDATFHHGWTLHSAPSNPSPEMRPVMTIIYYADGARVTALDHPNLRFDRALWLPGCEPGDAAASAFNPLLWPGGSAEVETPVRDGKYWRGVADVAKALKSGKGFTDGD